MAERASVFQTVQIGEELTPGTEVNADIKLPAVQFDVGITPEIMTYRGSGYKHPSVAALTKEWVEASISGPVTYNEVVYLMSSVLDTATITDNTGANGEADWAFAPDPDGADTPITYTVEQGGGGRAHQFTYGLVTALGFTFGDDGIEMNGTMIGKALEDGITMTATPTELALVPVTRPQVKVYLDSSWANLGNTQLTRVLSAEWSISDRYGPVWALTGTSDWAADVELVPTLELKLMVEADATGMGLLTQMRANSTRFIRIEAIGDEIGTGQYYTFQLNTAAKVTDVEPFSDEDGVYAIEWTFEGMLDTTSGNVYTALVTNTVGSL